MEKFQLTKEQHKMYEQWEILVKEHFRNSEIKLEEYERHYVERIDPIRLVLEKNVKRYSCGTSQITFCNCGLGGNN